jgi:hypothetical protein
VIPWRRPFTWTDLPIRTRRQRDASLHADQQLDPFDGLRAPGSIALGVQRAGTRECRLEPRIRPRLGAFHRTGGRLPVELSTDRLTQRRPDVGTGSTQGGFDLRDIAAAGAGLGGCDVQAQADTGEKAKENNACYWNSSAPG